MLSSIPRSSACSCDSRRFGTQIFNSRPTDILISDGVSIQPVTLEIGISLYPAVADSDPVVAEDVSSREM